MNSETFTQRLARLRKQHAFSYGQLAVAVGVSKSALWSIEAGKEVPSLRTVVALARAFGMEPGALLAGLDWTEYER